MRVTTLAELSGHDRGRYDRLLDELPDALCGPDTCAATCVRGGRAWHLLATRSPYPVDRPAMRGLRRADIVVSDRRLPGWCRPRWLKADADAAGRRTGGLAIRLGAEPRGDHGAGDADGAPLGAGAAAGRVRKTVGQGLRYAVSAVC